MKLQLRDWLLVTALLVPLARGQHDRFVCVDMHHFFSPVSCLLSLSRTVSCLVCYFCSSSPSISRDDSPSLKLSTQASWLS